MAVIPSPWFLGMSGCAFAAGTTVAWVLQRRRPVSLLKRVLPAAHALAGRRPSAQIPVRGFDELVTDTMTRPLLDSIEHRMRLSQMNFKSDCLPVLQAFAGYVQFLPASESHHHAQPGGLWVHAMEVVDAALAIRAGTELPRGASTEDRKRLEHRWTVGVFIAALMHDIGKPMADLRVTLFDKDARQGKPWAALAGSMREAGATHYSVDFAPADARDYTMHQRLPAILMQQFVPARVMRWLSEDPDLMRELLGYLAAEAGDCVLGDIVKRADSESVRRNLLTGPRTRFASARTVPVIERLMDALRRMLRDGTSLPLNRAGAVGWVFDDCIWFVCGRLADDVRTHLGENESLQGIPGKEKNDRLFDIWQEYGAIVPNPDTGGAIWRVRVECDSWSPPDALTVLRFPLAILFPTGDAQPGAMVGRIIPVIKAAAAPAATTTAATRPAAPTAQKFATSAPAASLPPMPKPRGSNAAAARAAESVPTGAEPPSPAAQAPVAAQRPKKAAPPPAADIPTQEAPTAAAVPAGPSPVPWAETPEPLPPIFDDDLPPDAVGLVDAWRHDEAPWAADAAVDAQPDQLDAVDRAHVEPAIRRTEATAEVSEPLKPYEKKRKHPAPAKDAPPLAKAFMAWVAQCVNTGEIKYNEDGALVHFVPEGALLFSPEIFKRFSVEHASVTDGPVREFLDQHGERAFAKLQNELSKSGYTRRNGDENLHYYVFTKGGGGVSRTAAYYLIPNPELFWRPVPPPNPRIQRAERPASTKKLPLPGAPKGSTNIRSQEPRRGIPAR